MAQSKTQVKKTDAQVPTEYDYGGDFDQGYENQTQDDLTIPFLSVLQSNSPQLDTIEAAKAGMLINTVTEELTKPEEGVAFVPVTTEHCYVEWTPRVKGGGFVAKHDVDSPTVLKALDESQEFGVYLTPEGNELVETFYVYAVSLDEDLQPGEAFVIPFTSTKIKKYKRWSTKINTFMIRTPAGRRKPPIFAHQVKITAVKERNNKGDFWNFDLAPLNGSLVESLLPPGSPALEAAKDFRETVAEGNARVAYDTQKTADGAGGDARPQKTVVDNEEIPF